jgi:hypothetical protein
VASARLGRRPARRWPRHQARVVPEAPTTPVARCRGEPCGTSDEPDTHQMPTMHTYMHVRYVRTHGWIGTAAPATSPHLAEVRSESDVGWAGWAAYVWRGRGASLARPPAGLPMPRRKVGRASARRRCQQPRLTMPARLAGWAPPHAHTHTHTHTHSRTHTHTRANVRTTSILRKFTRRRAQKFYFQVTFAAYVRTRTHTTYNTHVRRYVRTVRT